MGKKSGDWNAQQYLRFAKERTQPTIDLIHRLAIQHPRTILDVGCGPGNSTAQLALRYPGAEITGIDNSEDMIARAKADYPELAFQLRDITQGGLPTASYDIVFSNAVIQWIPDHRRLLRNLFKLVKPGGVLACQLPMNHDEPSHRNLQELAVSEKWKERFRDFRVLHTLSPSEYYDLFTILTDHFSMWLTTYFHRMKGTHRYPRMVKGTRLRPYLTQLPDAERDDFERELLERYIRDYHIQTDDRILLRFPRFFFVLRK